MAKTFIIEQNWKLCKNCAFTIPLCTDNAFGIWTPTKVVLMTGIRWGATSVVLRRQKHAIYRQGHYRYSLWRTIQYILPMLDKRSYTLLLRAAKSNTHPLRKMATLSTAVDWEWNLWSTWHVHIAWVWFFGQVDNTVEWWSTFELDLRMLIKTYTQPNLKLSFVAWPTL